MFSHYFKFQTPDIMHTLRKMVKWFLVKNAYPFHITLATMLAIFNKH